MLNLCSFFSSIILTELYHIGAMNSVQQTLLSERVRERERNGHRKSSSYFKPAISIITYTRYNWHKSVVRKRAIRKITQSVMHSMLIRYKKLQITHTFFLDLTKHIGRNYEWALEKYSSFIDVSFSFDKFNCDAQHRENHQRTQWPFRCRCHCRMQKKANIICASLTTQR